MTFLARSYTTEAARWQTRARRLRARADRLTGDSQRTQECRSRLLWSARTAIACAEAAMKDAEREAA